MVLDGRCSIRVFYIVSMVVLMVVALTANSNCPINCKCEPQLYKVNCSAANVTDSAFKHINERTEYLDLSRNDLSQLPEALLTYFENIVYLDLSFNKISTIRRYAFTRMLNLQNLDLSYNLIESLSNIAAETAFLGNPKLRHLNLSNNPLVTLGEVEDQILCSKSLLQLDVSHCQISHIQGSITFQGLPRLMFLNIANNILSRIEGFFSHSLVSLDISENKIQLFHFDNLNGLRELRISNNQRLTDQFSKLSSKSISYVDASFCSIYLANYASDLPNTRTVILKGNLIKTISAYTFENNSKLENLDLSNNRITWVHELAFYGADSLRNLDLSVNSISTIAENTFTFTRYLYNLNLSSNSFHNLGHMKGPSLKNLDLSYCKIDSIAANALIQTPSISTFNISYNFIEKLPDNLTSNSLQVLNLAYCRLSTIHIWNFYQLPQLKEIDLSGNRLVYIKDTIFVNNKLVYYVNLANNPWRCDCQDVNFSLLWTYLTKPMRIPVKSLLVCQFPENVTGWTWENACSGEWLTEPKKIKDIIVLLIIVLVLFVSGVVACIVAVRENWMIRRHSSRSNDELEHAGTVQGAQTDSDNEAAMTESIRKLTQLPSYDEALLLPKRSVSSNDSDTTPRSSREIDLNKITKRQSATQTDESITALFTKKDVTENVGMTDACQPGLAKNENRQTRLRRRSLEEIEYINITATLPVQCTEL